MASYFIKLPKAVPANTYVPYTGATSDVDLGSYSLLASGFTFGTISETQITFDGSNSFEQNYNGNNGYWVNPGYYPGDSLVGINTTDGSAGFANGNIGIDAAGNLTDNLRAVSISVSGKQLNDGVNASLDWSYRILFDETGFLSASYGHDNRFLYDNNENASINWNSRTLFDDLGVVSLVYNESGRMLADSLGIACMEWGGRVLIDSGSGTSIDWQSRLLKDTSGGVSTDWNTRYLMDASSLQSIDWQSRYLISSSGTQFFNWSTSNQIKTIGSMSLATGFLTPAARLHVDGGTATASAIKFTAGTTTGQTSTDGFDVGIVGTGECELRQRENNNMSFYTNNTLRFFITGAGVIQVSDGVNYQFSTSTNGTKLGTATTQKIGFWNATPIVQPTTSTAAATFVANAGTAVNDASTFDGYTIGKVVKALRNAGLLA